MAESVEYDDIDKVTLFRAPLRTITIMIIIIINFLMKVLQYLAKKWIFLIVISFFIIISVYVEGPHTPYVTQFEEISYFVLWWIGLGVASSVGLGTGLHTFILFLGPHIAKVTMEANKCQYIPRMIPSRWNFEYFEHCTQKPDVPITFWEILFAVQLEGFLWGLGTAIGELPPYFVAKAATLARKADNELEELLQGDEQSLMYKVKHFVYNNIEKYAFIIVVLFASIPNPLFDLAGLTCGHFLVPFSIFFTATCLGKAVFKVHIQMIFIIFAFSKARVEVFLNFIERNLPFLKNSLSEMLQKQKDSLEKKSDSEKPFIAKLWDIFLMIMIGWFLISIINSLVHKHLQDEKGKDKKNNKKVE